MPTAKAITNIVRGRVRRQSSVGVRATRTTAQSQRNGTSGRRDASTSALIEISPTSAQSRHTRLGGGGDAAGASQSARTGLVMPS